MDLDQLRCFVAVADQGSFTRAAVVLRLPQPRLSRAVRALEVELRQNLFHRDGRGVRLTDPGRRFLAHARGVLVQLERAIGELDGDRGEPIGQVVVGLPHSVSRVLTVPSVLEFQRRFPRGRLRVTEGLTVHLQEWLLAGRLDVALLHDPMPTPALETLALHRENLLVVGPATHARRRAAATIELRRLADVPLIMPGRPHPVRMLVETELANLGLKPNVVLEMDSVGGILDMVEQGLGHAVISMQALELRYGPARYSSSRIVAPELTSTLVLARSSERPSSPLLAGTMELLQDVLGRTLPRPALVAPAAPAAIRRANSR